MMRNIGQKVQKKRPRFKISVFFHNKGFDYNLDNVKNLFPDKIKIDEPPSVTIRNKILHY